MKSACRGQTPKSGSDIERQPKEVDAPVPHLSIPGLSSHLSPFLLAGLDVGLQRRVSPNAWLASGRIHDSRDTKEKRRFNHELNDHTSSGVLSLIDQRSRPLLVVADRDSSFGEHVATTVWHLQLSLTDVRIEF